MAPPFLLLVAFQVVIIGTITSHKLRIGRCNSDKAHFNQIIKSKVRMNRMTQIPGTRLRVIKCSKLKAKVWFLWSVWSISSISSI